MSFIILITMLILFVLPSSIMAQETDSREDIAQKIADETDIFAAVEYLIKQDDLVASVKALNTLQRKAYWERKDISQCISFGRAGLQLGLTESRRLTQSNPELAEQLLGQAKSVSYNLASFAWPGWNEKDIELSASDIAVGLDAAKVNLRLAIELKRSADPMSKAHWILGAHYLASGNFDNARIHFEKASEYANEAGLMADVLLNKGYRLIAEIVATPNNQDHKSALDGVMTELKPMKDGEFFAEQLTTALIFFTPSVSH